MKKEKEGKMKKGILKPGFLTESAGPTKTLKFGWNNLMRGVSHPVTCQACLKEWPECEQGTSRTVSIFLGLEIVEECCGALLDKIYLESSAEFTIHRLLEVLADPKNHPMVLAALRQLFPKFITLFSSETSPKR